MQNYEMNSAVDSKYDTALSSDCKYRIDSNAMKEGDIELA